jgi:hypothetical protein
MDFGFKVGLTLDLLFPTILGLNFFEKMTITIFLSNILKMLEYLVIECGN